MLRIVDRPCLEAPKKRLTKQQRPPEGVTLPVTFSTRLSPTLSDQILNVTN